jgi:hypothetical protein
MAISAPKIVNDLPFTDPLSFTVIVHAFTRERRPGKVGGSAGND